MFFRRVKSLKHDDLSRFTQGGASNFNPNGTLNIEGVEIDLVKELMNCVSTIDTFSPFRLLSPPLRRVEGRLAL